MVRDRLLWVGGLGGGHSRRNTWVLYRWSGLYSSFFGLLSSICFLYWAYIFPIGLLRIEIFLIEHR